jgi:hypothetical protein
VARLFAGREATHDELPLVPATLRAFANRLLEKTWHSLSFQLALLRRRPQFKFGSQRLKSGSFDHPPLAS